MGARSAMDSVQIRQTLPRETVQYRHPYGGLARDVYVTRDGFARFFDIPVEYVDEMPVNMKCMDRFFDNVEVCGYIRQYYVIDAFNGIFDLTEMFYVITIIDYNAKEN